MIKGTVIATVLISLCLVFALGSWKLGILSLLPNAFPAAMMLGFHATGLTDDIRFNDGELVEARWFHRDDLRTGAVPLPPRESIACRLIETWLDRP